MLESSFHDPLSAQINATTRSHHTILNHLITSRLPLCLPPYANTPEAYATGLSYFAEIFYAFEETWDDLIRPSAGTNKGLEEAWEALDEQYPNGSAADLHFFLRTLRPRGLARVERIRADFAYIQGLAGVEVLMGLERSKAVEEFVGHIRNEVMGNPHLLVAYAWTLYMAIFSGGRWIRAQLHTAGKDFWMAKAAISSRPSKPETDHRPTLEELKEFEHLGLSLWFFNGYHDGEEIKAEFKRRLNDGEHVLTPAQRNDIIVESQEIFDRFKAMVDDLDEAFQAAQASHLEQVEISHSKTMSETKAPGKKASEYLFEMPGYAGLALVISGIGWYALYHASAWS